MAIENTDLKSFIDGVKRPLGELADACLYAYEENGDECLREAANALRAIEVVDLEGCDEEDPESPSKPLPWRIRDRGFDREDTPILAANDTPVLVRDRGVNPPELPVSEAIVECLNTVYALQNAGKTPRDLKSPKGGQSKQNGTATGEPEADHTEDEVLAILNEYIRQGLTPDEQKDCPVVTLETRFGKDLGFDALDMVEAIMAIEEKIGKDMENFYIGEEDSETSETVADLVDAVKRAKAFYKGLEEVD